MPGRRYPAIDASALNGQPFIMITKAQVKVGMALLPASIARMRIKGEVTFYSFKQELPHREVIALWSKSRPLIQTAKALVNCMKAACTYWL